MPWKNGLGVTTEIARAPLEGDFDWRVSVARVAADGPFSTFPGCDRVILTLEGAGMVLAQPGTAAEVTLGLLEPWAFSGDAITTCTLRGGPIRDFNLIARRTAYVPSVSVLRPEAAETIGSDAETSILYCAEGAIAVEAAGTFALASEETLIVERTGEERGAVVIRPSAPRTVVILATLTVPGGRSARVRE